MYIFNIFDLILFSIISFLTVFISFYLLKKESILTLIYLISKSKNVVTSLGISFTISFILIFLYTIIFNQDIWNLLPNRNYIFLVQ